MPKISVGTVLFYKGDADRFPLESEVVLEGVDRRFEGVRFPTKGKTFLYGHNNAGSNHLIRLGPLVGLEAIHAEITVEIEQWIRHKVNLSNDPERGLMHSRLLSFARATKEVLEAVDQVCSPEVGESIFGAKGVVVHPQALDALLDDDRFKHLWVVAYTVDTREIGRVQVATVFNMDAVDEIQTGSELDAVEFLI